jgi:hypothetical protein
MLKSHRHGTADYWSEAILHMEDQELAGIAEALQRTETIYLSNGYTPCFKAKFLSGGIATMASHVTYYRKLM